MIVAPTKMTSKKLSNKQIKQANSLKLDQTLDASFPASDPPSYTLGRAKDLRTEDEPKLNAKPVPINLNNRNFSLTVDSLDVRGYKVETKDGETLGKVKDLLVSQDKHKVRFLEVVSDSFLGLDEKTFVIPVAFIDQTSNAKVYLKSINKTIQTMLEAPTYAPEIM